MAGPGGTEVGRVSVKVVPDVDGFRDAVKKELEKVEKMSADVTVEIDLTKFKAQIEEIKLLLKSIGDEKVVVDIDQKGGINGVTTQTRKAAAEAKKLAQNLKDALGDGEQHKLSKFTQAMESFGGAIEKVGAGIIELGSKGFSQLGEGFKSVGGSLASMVAQIILWIPLIAGLIGLVTFLVGFLASALLTLPALLFGILGPLAAVVLGFEGIKKAAKTLQPELDKLKKRLSDTFAKELKPLFESLKGIFPVISDGLNNIAIGVSKFITELSKVFTSVDGVNDLALAFKNVNVFLDALLPGIKSFLQTLLNLATIPEIFESLGGAISDAFKQLQGFFQTSIENGSLLKGVKNFRIILNDVVDLFADLLTNSLKFFNGAAPGMDKFFRALGDFFGRIDWERLGKAFGTIFEKLGEAISQIPPETIDSITTSFVDLAEAVGDLLSGKSFDILIAAFQAFIDLATFVINAIDLIAEGFANFGDALAEAPQKAEEFFAWLRNLPNVILEALQGGGEWLFAKGREIMQGLWDGIVQKGEEVWAWIRNIPNVILENLQGAGEWLLAKGREILQGLWDGLENKAIEVWAWIRDIPNKILSFFAGAGRWLFGVGVDIMQGLIDGIKSMIASLFGTIGGAAKGAAAAARSAIDSHSPSRVFMAIGQDIGEGLIIGIEKMNDKVANAASEMAASVIKPLTVDSAFAMSLSASGADLTATSASQLNVAASVDGNGLEERIVKALSNWKIDGKGVARTVNNANTRQNRRG